VGHVLRSSGLLYVESSHVRVFSLASRLVKMRQRVVHVAPSWRLRQSQSKTDGSMRWAVSDPATLALPFFMY
jgi:hypothetical protein